MPKKICNSPRCNELVNMKQRYCAEHTAVEKEDTKTKSRIYDQEHRNKKHDKFYHSRDWKATRILVLSNSGGLCKHCLENDYITKADMVDHIIPLDIDYSKRLDRDNLQPLCNVCHNKKTAADLELYRGRL